MIKNFLLVGLGGGIGTMLRYGANLILAGKTFPLATLLINITGSLLIGIIFGISMKNENFANNWKLFLTTGICGGFTTFSAFSLENIQLLQNEKYVLSAVYIAASIVLGIGAAMAGFKIAS